MKLKELSGKNLSQQSPKIIKEYAILDKLYLELEKKDLPAEVVEFINNRTDYLNTLGEQDPRLLKLLRKTKQDIVKQVEKQVKIVPRNYYRNLWMVIGMSVYGLPIGVIYATITQNWGLLGIGLPIGMLLGMGHGARLDKKASEELRQLDLDINQ